MHNGLYQSKENARFQKVWTYSYDIGTFYHIHCELGYERPVVIVAACKIEDERDVGMLGSIDGKLTERQTNEDSIYCATHDLYHGLERFDSHPL